MIDRPFLFLSLVNPYLSSFLSHPLPYPFLPPEAHPLILISLKLICQHRQQKLISYLEFIITYTTKGHVRLETKSFIHAVKILDSPALCDVTDDVILTGSLTINHQWSNCGRVIVFTS